MHSHTSDKYLVNACSGHKNKSTSSCFKAPDGAFLFLAFYAFTNQLFCKGYRDAKKEKSDLYRNYKTFTRYLWCKKKARAGASKHQLVLFAIQPFYAFTNHSVRVIEIVLQSFGPTHAVTTRFIRVIQSRPEQTMTSMVPSLFFEEAIIQNISKW